MSGQFDQAKREAAELAARPAARPMRRAVVARKLVPSIDRPVTAAGAVLSSCCAAQMGQLTRGTGFDGQEFVVWLRPNGWSEVGGRKEALLVDGVERPQKRERFRMIAHAKGRLAVGGTVHSPRREDHPDNRNPLPLTLDCPECGAPNRLDGGIKLPSGLGSPWRGA